MISLKRNRRGIPVEASGIRSRQSSMYTPNQTDLFNISRSKFNDFLTCERCFYLDRVKGLVSPSTPGWTLNETTDRLLKKEFDVCREQQQPHRIFEKFDLKDVVPFKHPDLERWRDSLHHGLQYRFGDSNIVLTGGIDDVWFDQRHAELIVVDYKSQANNRPVNTKDYLSSGLHESYKTQLDFYAYLFTKMAFAVSPVGYFYVCNADRSAPAFSGQMTFEETLVPYSLDIGWIDSKVLEMVEVLNSHDIPTPNLSCENCAYARQRTLLEMAA